MPQETLDDVLNAIRTKPFYVSRSEKNKASIYKAGLMFDDLKDLVMTLTRADYVSGPEGDYDGSKGDIWKFKKRAFGETFYIKLKMKEPLIVISCHIDDIQA